MHRTRRTVVLLVSLVACRGSSPSAQAVNQQQLERLVDSLMPSVSKASGLQFKSTPKSAVRTHEQIRAYLVHKMDRELPPAIMEGIDATYRLLGLLPDSLDLRKLFLDLYTEQIAGFYEPDSLTLYAVVGTDPGPLRLVLAHELVHALQHQYVPLDSILHDDSDADRQAAAQAVLEGQATLASMGSILPGMNFLDNDDFWKSFRDGLRLQQLGTGVYATAPMVIREGLTFPYLEGSEFMRWFNKNHPGKTPFGAAMPQSTEQILHPDRYANGDVPIPVRFESDTTGVIFDDTFGEFDVHLLAAGLAGVKSDTTNPVSNWGGDRLRIYRTPDGPALVWLSAWDNQAGANNFRSGVGAMLLKNSRPGYRTTVVAMPVVGKPGVQVVIAPASWVKWKALPRAR
jgi:hypothetical protein